jgi:hypothetical protein
MTRATLSPGVQACVGRDLARQVAIKHEPSPPPAPKPNGNGRAAAPDDGYVPQGELASAISEIITECAADITPERITWLWKEWLALGKLHLIAGVPEAGKTTIALAFAAIQTSGGTWPDGTHARPGNVLMWTSEDDLADTLVPRLIRMGADLNHIHFVKQTKQTDGKPRPFNPSIDMPALQAKAITIGNIVMLIIDPVVAVMPGNRDSHKGAETRSGLQPLLNFTETIKLRHDRRRAPDKRHSRTRPPGAHQRLRGVRTIAARRTVCREKRRGRRRRARAHHGSRQVQHWPVRRRIRISYRCRAANRKPRDHGNTHRLGKPSRRNRP